MGRYRETYLLGPRGPPSHRQHEYLGGIRYAPHNYARLAPYKVRARWAPPKQSSILRYGDVEDIENMPRSVHLPNLPTDVTVNEIREWCDRAVSSLRKPTEETVDPIPEVTKSVAEHVTLLTGSRRRWMANITLLDQEHRDLLKEGAKTVQLRPDLPTFEVSLPYHNLDRLVTNNYTGSELYAEHLQKAKT